MQDFEAQNEAARLLRSAEASVKRTYGGVSSEKAVELAEQWIALANAIARGRK